jgi:hypothetical protein
VECVSVSNKQDFFAPLAEVFARVKRAIEKMGNADAIATSVSL